MTPSHYPLQWPNGWPRTQKPDERQVFRSTLSSALNNLKEQVRLMGGVNLVLSSNYTLGNEKPKDTGVVAYFVWNQKLLAIPCDRWARVEYNVQAIALTIEAMRGMDRYGAKHMIEAMFTGFKALPASTSRPWWGVLDLPNREASVDAIKSAYKTLAKKWHPDANGGKRDAWDELETAYNTAKAERGF